MSTSRMIGRVLWTTTAALFLVVGTSSGSGIQLTVDDSNWSTEGTTTLGYFGQFVNSAGDVNGDDYEDFIVGSQHVNSANGRAWLFYGGPEGSDGIADVVFNPPITGSSLFFGFQASGAGDVNGDGYDDVMIGCLNCDLGTSGWRDEGMVFFYYGGDGAIDTTYDWRVRGVLQYSHLGWGAGPAGDVNGDGYDDVLVGGYCYSGCADGPVQHAYLFFGAANGLELGGARPEGTPSNCDWSVQGDQTGAYFGTSMGGAGDVDGDGYDDFFVGAQHWNGAAESVGKVWVWHGSETGPTTPGNPATADWSKAGTSYQDYFGGYAGSDGGTAAAGDVDGDGYDDFLIGCYGCDVGATNNGKAELWFGSEDGLSAGAADWTVAGLHEGDSVGLNVTSGGDYNADGFDDILVSQHAWDAVWDPNDHSNEGRVMLWFGSTNGPLDQPLPIYSDCLMSADQVGGLFGYALAGATDVNNDGYDDFLVGAQYYDTDGDPDPGGNQGKVFGFLSSGLLFGADFESGDLLRWD